VSGFRTIRGTRSWISSGAGRGRARIGAGRFIEWLDIAASKFYDWRERYGKVNEHNGWVPRDFWLEDWEEWAIIGFHLKNPLEGYRRLTFMMLDSDIVAVSPSSVWRVLGLAGLLSKWKNKPSKKGTGFEQPLAAHHTGTTRDVSYINNDTAVVWAFGPSLFSFLASLFFHSRGLCERGPPNVISSLKPIAVAVSAACLVHLQLLEQCGVVPNWPAENGVILANGARQLSISR